MRLLELDSFITNLTHIYLDRYLGFKFNHITWTENPRSIIVNGFNFVIKARPYELSKL
jgi:hypothetical protein